MISRSRPEGGHPERSLWHARHPVTVKKDGKRKKNKRNYEFFLTNCEEIYGETEKICYNLLKTAYRTGMGRTVSAAFSSGQEMRELFRRRSPENAGPTDSGQSRMKGRTHK